MVRTELTIIFLFAKAVLSSYYYSNASLRGILICSFKLLSDDPEGKKVIVR